METTIVHPRIFKLHTDMAEKDVLDAWSNIIHSKTRLGKDPQECIAVGVDGRGRLIEMVAVRLSSGDMLVFHAMTPPTQKTLKELELLGTRRK